ncbi:monovalent cation/H+ antiporter complex subunit F [Luteipulveratus flavus]|uniref:Monovalent cation/H+ antiporter complex subunit F n=1 Tax=Luteipulveratus flavus TaxID=3031728 RepID=A0ABT6CCA3_9MICO|nr:monovalent cation/H+ antiporter complex subunit F [Luteipulveratus sp. YIM 133296]MDF8266538.1 monovalent cation/H+ antiporter complex subunit F [Luteipulveratus sp. YIM 133296]
MSVSDLAFWVIGGLLTLAALLALVRIVRGPSVLDRVVGTDVLVSIVVCALGTEAALTRHSTTLPILISLSLVAFVGAVAVARFVARDRDTAPGQDEVAPAGRVLTASGPVGPPAGLDSEHATEAGPDVSPDGRMSRGDDLADDRADPEETS